MPKVRTEVTLNVLIELGTLEKAKRLAEVLSLIHGHRVTRPYAIDKAITEALEKAYQKLESMTTEAKAHE
jgi:type II secretory pathway predicted ATPase ExeA